MKLSSIASTGLMAFVLALPASAMPTSGEIVKRDDCKADASFIDGSWGESALTRRRVHFTAENPIRNGFDYAAAGGIWTENNSVENCNAINNNQQTYDLAGKGWVIDFNEVQGPAGDNAANCLLNRFVDNWRNYACSN